MTAIQRKGKTERLVLRPLKLADAAQIQREFPHWEIVRYLVNRVPWPYPPDGALHYCGEIALPQMSLGNEWHWTIRRLEDPERLIGVLSMSNGERDNRGYWMGLQWQGQGYMSEACAWANDFWFDVLGQSVLRVSKAAANQASRRISEKHGMRVVGHHQQEYVSGQLPAETWELTAEEWRAWKAIHN